MFGQTKHILASSEGVPWDSFLGLDSVFTKDGVRNKSSLTGSGEKRVLKVRPGLAHFTPPFQPAFQRPNQPIPDSQVWVKTQEIESRGDRLRDL
jgi:hypothetical protein